VEAAEIDWRTPILAAEPPPDADFLCYYSGPNVMVEPRNSAAKQYLGTTLDGNALAWRNGAAIVETSAVVPLVHRLIAAGFNVVGQSAIMQQTPRLYVYEGKWWLYTGGRNIPEKLVRLILKGVGKPN
jgi:hypothetical protein